MTSPAKTEAPRKHKHALILCHPSKHSFNGAVVETYRKTAERCGHATIVRDLYRLGFDPVLKEDERPLVGSNAPAPDVAAELRAIRSADALVLVYPIWFGTPPAMLKGYVERVLGSGISHRDIRAERPASFLTGKHLLSITTSGNTLQWLHEKGAWLSLRNVFDAYLESAFGMASSEHLHLASIVKDLDARYVAEELYRVEEFARAACARIAQAAWSDHANATRSV
jgi:NAD(P)H dehydrogenase (quinone)